MRPDRAIAVGFLFAFLVAPVVYLLGAALIPSFADLGSFAAILFGNPRSREITINSLNLALLTTTLSLLVGVPLALLLARYKFPGQRLLRPLLLFPLILPPFVGALGMRRLLARFGPLNLFLLDWGIVSSPPDWLGAYTLAGTALLQTLHLFPIITLNTLSSALALDDSLEESARLCGAGRIEILRRIVLPLLLPGAFAGASIVFIWSLTDLGTPLMFNFRDLLAVEIYQLSDEIHGNPMAYLLVSFVLVLTTTLFVLARSASSSGTKFSLSKGGSRRAVRTIAGIPGILVSIGVFALLTAAVAPHLMVALLSVTQRWFMSPLPQEYTLDHFTDLIHHPLTVRSVRNSFFLSLGSTGLDLVLGLIFAHWLIRAKGFTKHSIDVLLMIPLAVPGIVIAFGYLTLYSNTLLDPKRDPFFLLMFGYAIRRLPFMLRSITTGLEQLNPAYEEAARLCGAGKALIQRRIVLPLILPSILAGSLLCFVFALLEVSESLLLATNEKDFPLTKALYALLSRPDGMYLASALGVAATVLLATSLWGCKKLLGERAGEVLGR